MTAIPRAPSDAAGRTAGLAPGRVVFVMGVSGAGKTSVGRRVAAALGVRFIDADDLHPPANVARMRAGIPLGDAERAPWLRDVHDAVASSVGHGRSVVVACSALKARYRAVLLDGLRDPLVVMLQVDRDVLQRRLRRRRGHFMPPGLLDSQLQDLELPVGAIMIDANQSLGATVDAVLEAIRAR